MKQIIIVMLSVFLAACQYHLRGEEETPEVLRHIYLQSASPQLQASFKETLRMAGGNLTQAPEANGVIVNVLNERFDRRSLSLSSTGKTNEYQLFYVLDFEVLSATKQVFMPHQTVEVNRDYFNNQQDIMGKNNEEALIREEMYRQAAHSVIDRGRASLKQALKK
jgi:LPS-assembly lipoprotein